MRVLVTALALCAVSFLAGLAGDLSIASPVAVEPASARVALPPHLVNAVRAHPLTTRSADAAPRRSVESIAVEAREKPRASLKRAPKSDPVHAPKARPGKA
ncbi:MAG: hypothetical protein WDM79_10035 [Terricaulis sp.]